MLKLEQIKRLSITLQIGVGLIGVTALAFRATLYWSLPAASGDTPGSGDLLDFALAMLLFVVCALCATAGVAISLLGGPGDKRHAYQAFFVGVLSFLAYDLLHPLLPRLM